MATSSSSSPDARTLVGAGAAGTTAAQSPPPAPQPPSRRERRYRVRGDETVAAGMRRAARGRLADSSDALAGASGRDELNAAVHGTRKSIKRVRATLRLSREAIGEDTYARENAELRTIARRLSAARDAQVLIDTLTALEKRYGEELDPGATAGLRARLDDDRGRALAQLADDGDLAVVTRQALEEARARAAQWTFATHGVGAVAPGLRRVYARGRRRIRAACDEPTAERLHDARKRVKDLWHAAELLHAAHPKRMKRLARDAHALASLIGDHHDLSVLREYVGANPQLFSDMGSRAALITVLDRRRDKLQRRALKLGRRLYEQPPKRFAKAVERGWRKRVGDRAEV